MNKICVLILCALVGAGILIAGCASTPPPQPVTTAVPTQVQPTATETPVQQPSFTLGDHYLQKSYTFSSENDVVTEQFYVDNPSWGIDFNITPLNDNVNYCWFTIDVTNVNNGQVDNYGYGRTFSFDLDQKIPMYRTGPYKIEMKGNRVKVVVTAAKRYP
jgi:hypothetical protein